MNLPSGMERKRRIALALLITGVVLVSVSLAWGHVRWLPRRGTDLDLLRGGLMGCAMGLEIGAVALLLKRC